LLLALNLPAEAQQPKKVPRIGVLSPGSDNPSIDILLKRLNELGWLEGQTITIEYRFADGNEERLPVLAAELVHANVDIIVSTSTQSTVAARQLTRNIPIVTTFFGAGSRISTDIPTRNETGLYLMSPELGGKRLELLKEIIPKISRVAVLASVKNVDEALSIKNISAVARSLGMQLQILNLQKSNEIEHAFVSMVKGDARALAVMTPSMFVRTRAEIIALAAKNRLAAMYPDSRFTDAGGLMSYGPNNAEQYRRAAYFVDRILKGAKPTDLPVEQPTKFELVINLKTARELNLKIAPEVLMWADRVIK
jgi:putative ABC transport system substrate-binding protein